MRVMWKPFFSLFIFFYIDKFSFLCMDKIVAVVVVT